MDQTPAQTPPPATPSVEDRLLALSRRLTPAAKLRQLGEMVDAVAALTAADLASHDPTLGARQVLEAIAARRYGRPWLASMLRPDGLRWGGLRLEGAPARPAQGG